MPTFVRVTTDSGDTWDIPVRAVFYAARHNHRLQCERLVGTGSGPLNLRAFGAVARTLTTLEAARRDDPRAIRELCALVGWSDVEAFAPAGERDADERDRFRRAWERQSVTVVAGPAETPGPGSASPVEPDRQRAAYSTRRRPLARHPPSSETDDGARRSAPIST